MKLELYLRSIVASKIRPNYIKDRCEVCGSITSLHLHHLELFSDLLSDTLKQLKLEHMNETDDYEEIDLLNIKEIILGKHLLSGYLTLCKTCHIKEHDKNRLEITNNRKKAIYDDKLKLIKEKAKQQYIDNEIIPYIEKLINIELKGEEKRRFINKISPKRRDPKSYNKINQWFRENELSYVIMPKRRNTERYWIIKRL